MKKTIIGLLVLVVMAMSVVVYLKSKTIGNAKNTPMQNKEKVNSKTGNVNSSIEAEDEVGSLYFDKSEQAIATNSDFTLNAMINPDVKQVNSIELHVVYNAKLLKLEKINPSEKFSLILASPVIDNEKGTASITLAVPLGSPVADKIISLASFDFKSLSDNGQAEISFTDKSIAAASGVSGNVIGSRKSTIVNIK